MTTFVVIWVLIGIGIFAWHFDQIKEVSEGQGLPLPMLVAATLVLAAAFGPIWLVMRKDV